jgi:hypothetical protein
VAVGVVIPIALIGIVVGILILVKKKGCPKIKMPTIKR